MFWSHGLLAAFLGTWRCCTQFSLQSHTLCWDAPPLCWGVSLFQNFCFSWVCPFLMSLNQFCLSIYCKIVLTAGLHNDHHLLLAYLTLASFQRTFLREAAVISWYHSPPVSLSTVNLSNLALTGFVMEMAMNSPHVPLAVRTGTGYDSMPNNHGISKQLLTRMYTAINHLEHQALKHQLPLWRPWCLQSPKLG